MSVTTGQKRKTFPALDAPVPKLHAIGPATNSQSEDSEDESDAPEAVTLTSGRAAADAQSSAIQDHRKRLLQKKKELNKIQEAFIQSTKSKSLSAARAVPESETPANDDTSDKENRSQDSDADPSEIKGDSVLLARMEKAMQDASDEDEAEDESSDEELGGRQSSPPTASTRLPDSIFAAAAVEERKLERKRKKVVQSRDAKPKRRRVREGPSERVVSGRTVRVVKALDTPPPPPSRASRKKGAGLKGGIAFRRKWKQRDDFRAALQAQIRSRSGPAQRFAIAK
ncbi:hypothetical protein FRC10_011794 [Ceratobasidium sp. 414]|nr:hypothetical protein FRC10_011794 [Ceratobasidium sp. 414]